MRGRIAVVGAGVAGLRTARGLKQAGYEVVVFDKARGPSGRISTRRVDWGQFDHGAPCFTAHSPEFEAQVADWVERGVAAPWRARFAVVERGASHIDPEESVRYVGVPSMSALARDLSEGLSLETGLRIASLRRIEGRWAVVADDGFEVRGFDAVVCAVPAPQAVPLLASSPSLSRQARALSYRSCHVVMVRFAAPLELDFDAAVVRDSPLAWVAREASKPGRQPSQGWVLQSAPKWSEAHLDLPAEQVAELLLAAFDAAVGRPLPRPVDQAGHRWLYARVVGATPASEIWDTDEQIGICGDWTLGDGLDCAFVSAERLVARMTDALRAQSAA